MRKYLMYLTLATAAIMVIISCQDTEKKLTEGTLDSGYKYKFYTDVQGEPARQGQVVTMDYEVIDHEGNVLDDSRVAPIRPSVLIPREMTPDIEGNPLFGLLSLMTPGDSADVIVPIDSLPTPPAKFRHSSEIIYRVKLLTVEEAEAYSKRMHDEENAAKARRQSAENAAKEEALEAFNQYRSGVLEGRVIEKNQGMKVVVIDEGDGTTAEWGEKADVHYFGFFKNGESFDNSFRAGRPFTLQIGSSGAIQGWLAGIPEVPQGGTAILDIPASLAYGSTGNPPVIPPNSDLIFYVKVEKVYKQK